MWFFFLFNFQKMTGKSKSFLHHTISSSTGHLFFNYKPPLTPPQEGNVELRRSSGGAVILNANNAKDTNSRKNYATENHIYRIFKLFYICENLRVWRHSRSDETASVATRCNRAAAMGKAKTSKPQRLQGVKPLFLKAPSVAKNILSHTTLFLYFNNRMCNKGEGENVSGCY